VLALRGMPTGFELTIHVSDPELRQTFAMMLQFRQSKLATCSADNQVAGVHRTFLSELVAKAFFEARVGAKPVHCFSLSYDCRSLSTLDRGRNCIIHPARPLGGSYECLAFTNYFPMMTIFHNLGVRES